MSGHEDAIAASDRITAREISRRGFLTVSLAGASVVLLGSTGDRAYGAAPAPSTGGVPTATLALRPNSFGAVFVGDQTPRFAVSSNADTVRWTVRDVWGATVRSGSNPVRAGSVTLWVPVDNGYYTLEATGYRKGAAVASERISFGVLAPYRLPADSPFGANTHLQPPVMVPLMAALGITWARTDLTWTDVEPPPLAGWSTDVYQADASVALDTTVGHTGTSSAKLVNRSPLQDNFYATIAQEIAVLPNTTYTFSAWVKGQNVKALQFTIKPDWGSRIDAPSGTFDWTNVSFQYTTTTESALTFRLLSNDVTDAAWLDDASVTAAGSTTNLLVNPGFEAGLVSGYTFDTFDPYLNALSRQGIHPLPIVDYANPKYDAGQTPYTDSGRAAFAAYTTAVMQHYKGRFTAVEVYNEYNAGWFTTGPGDADPTYYAKLLAVTYDAIKAVDPSVAVVGGVTYGTALDWLTAVFEAGGMAHLDAISNHPYTGAPESGTPIDQLEQQVTALIEQYNGGIAKPVWVSELGWSLGDELTTAGYLVRGLVLSLAGGVQKYFWYDLVGDQNFGLLNQDSSSYTPRPAFVSYAVAIRLLTGRQLTGGGELATSGVRTYSFAGTGHDDDVIVLWSTNAHDTVAVATTRPLVLLDVAGSSSTVTPLAGNVYLTLTGAPVYLKGKGLARRAGLVATSARVDATAPQLVRTSDGVVTLTYVLDNTGATAADLTFTSLGVTTRVRAAAGQRIEVEADVAVSRLEPGRNTIITTVNDGRRTVGRLSSSVAIIAVPVGAVATVGTVDWNDQELALAPGGYGNYSSQFPNDVNFTVGDDPATAWSYIHPGPDDGWAGGKTHSFTLRFPLAAVPSKDLQLVVFLLDTHNTAPGAVTISLNGGAGSTVQLPAGSGSGYADGDAFTSADSPSQFAVVLPAAQLVVGSNQVSITKSSGSWMVYDAVGVYQA